MRTGQVRKQKENQSGGAEQMTRWNAAKTSDKTGLETVVDL